MKKQLLTFFLIGMAGAMQSQPTLLSSEMLAPGAVMHYKNPLSLTPIDTSIQGANAIWNFNTLSPQTGPDFVVTIANPAGTPYGALFPTANYAYVESPTTAYRYFNLTNSYMDRVGSYSTSANTFSDPQREYVFPLMLGVVNNDTWASSSSSFGGDYNINCIGYGSLHLPAITFPNTLMVRVDFDEVIYSMPVYFWYSADNGAMLLEYSPGDGTFILPFGLYINTLATGIQENDFIAGLRYNNPVNGIFKLHFTSMKDANITYSLENTLGQTVLSEELVSGEGLSHDISIDFSNFPQGIYLLSMQSGEGRKTLKLINSR